MPDINKLLILEIFDKYETYIEKISSKPEFDGKFYLDQIQNICIFVSNIEDEYIIDEYLEKINILDVDSESFITYFEIILSKLV